MINLESLHVFTCFAKLSEHPILKWLYPQIKQKYNKRNHVLVLNTSFLYAFQSNAVFFS
jgi:hypothetical protein